MNTIRLGVAILATGFCAMMATGDESGDGLKTTLSLGGTLTRGNSETVQGNATLAVEGEKTRLGSLRTGIEANYGESVVDDERSTTVDNAKFHANVRKTLSERTFAYVAGSVLYDDIARIDYRATVGPGLGVYLVKTDSASLSVEAGSVYVWEEVDGLRDDYVAYRLAERFELALSETSKLWQSAEYVPQAEDFKDYLITAELGIEAAVNSRVNVRLVLQNKYDNRPAEDVEKNDLTLIAGIGVKL